MGWYLYNFRLGFARRLREKGVETVFVSTQDEFVAKIKAAGFRWLELDMDRKSLSPLSGLRTVLDLSRIYRQEKPDLVHHFTAKCVFFGTLAAKSARVGVIVNSVTGLGHLAIDQRPHYRALFMAEKVLYRLALVHSHSRVIVQNQDDYEEFLRLKLIDPRRTALVRGSGVDTDRFHPREEREEAGKDDAIPRILFASRLLKTKGIHEVVAAARALKKKGIVARFQIAGERDPGNPATVTEEQLHAWREEGDAEFLGHLDPIDPWVEQAAIVVLPSYREGMPKIVLEASAMGKAVVTTNTQGCREAVVDGETGILVPVADVSALADALERLIRNPELRKTMGRAGRARMVEEFSIQRITEETWSVYQTGLPKRAN